MVTREGSAKPASTSIKILEQTSFGDEAVEAYLSDICPRKAVFEAMAALTRAP